MVWKVSVCPQLIHNIKHMGKPIVILHVCIYSFSHGWKVKTCSLIQLFTTLSYEETIVYTLPEKGIW